jgi:ABC-2 type transport system permease protein
VAHTRFLGGTTGLAYRLDRGTIIGWGGGLAVGGFIVGLIAKGSADI